MAHTKSRAARNPWLVAQRACAAAYKDGKPANSATNGCTCETTPVAQTKEVDKAVAQEHAATHARAKQAARSNS